MTRDEAVALVQEGLGFSTAHSSRIISHMKDAQREYEKLPDLPWFLTSEVSSRLTVPNEERVPVPEDFIREVEGDALFFFNATATTDEDPWVPLEKSDLQFLRVRFKEPGEPRAYSLLGSYFRIKPTPNAAFQLKLVYFKHDLVLDTNIENLWLKHAPDILIGEAGIRIAGPLRDQSALTIFQDRLAKGVAAMGIDNKAREHVNQRYVMGDPD